VDAVRLGQLGVDARGAGDAVGPGMEAADELRQLGVATGMRRGLA